MSFRTALLSNLMSSNCAFEFENPKSLIKYSPLSVGSIRSLYTIMFIWPTSQNWFMVHVVTSNVARVLSQTMQRIYETMRVFLSLLTRLPRPRHFVPGHLAREKGTM